jgi:predicted nucleic acid-binding protein
VTGFVLDASVAMTWCFEEDGTPDPDAILERLRSDAATVPSIWPYEIANALVVAERRGRITTTRSQEFLRFLASLPITVDVAAPEVAVLLTFARMFRLTAYDAAYFALSLRRGLPLATHDAALAKAAQAAGIKLLR